MRRSVAAIACAFLVSVPGVAAAQRCLGSDNPENGSRVMSVGGRVDIQENANSYGGTFSIANGMAGKPLYMRAHLRIIDYPVSSGTGFGFTFGKALLSSKNTDWCLFGSMESISVSSSSVSNYELGVTYGNSTPIGADMSFPMFIRGGMLMAMGGGTTSTDPFAEVGGGLQMKSGISVSVSYMGVFSDFSYDMYRVHVSYPFNVLKK